ncbi:MAG: HAD family phosphatase [Bacteroidales bacterium]|nr:HAD family phosphatase [Bacteroidales bacterium]
MLKKGIKNLIIDLGGVLVDFEYKRYIEEFKKIGLANADETLATFYQKDFFKNYEKGLISTKEFRDEIRNQIANQDLQDELIDIAWISILDDIPRYKLDLLLKLREHYMVYLLSNTNPIHWQWVCKFSFPYRGFRVENYFEHIFLSYEMHMLKPDKQIYNTVIETTGIKPEESFLIDDSAENCKMAKSLGFSTYTPKLKENWSFLFEKS